MNYLKNIYIKEHSFLYFYFCHLPTFHLVRLQKKVFVLAGQSNIDGRGEASKLSKAEMKLLVNSSPKIHFVHRGLREKLRRK